MDHSDLPEASSSRDVYSSAHPNITSTSSSWTFEPEPPLPDYMRTDVSVPRPSPFPSTTSPSRFSPSSTTPAVGISGRSQSIFGDEPARTPPIHLSNLEPLSSSSPEDWRNRRSEDEVRATVNRRRIPRVEKDVDDPTQADNSRSARIPIDRQQSTTLTTLSRLFAVKAATSPTESRDYSYTEEPPRRTRRCEFAVIR